jgi:hypothetical protein
MARKKTEGEQESFTPTAHELPPGYEQRGSDLVGYYTGNGPFHFTPQDAVLIDNKKFRDKISTLVRGVLQSELPLIDSEGNEIAGKVGDAVGLWLQNGMLGLKNMAGVPVYLFQDGLKDVGKGKPMKTYSLNVPKGRQGRPLMVLEDRRKETRHLPSLLPIAPSALAGPVAQTGGDDIPF